MAIIHNEEKEKLREEAKTKELVMRSCWNCNPAHEHLKNSEHPILCLFCGRYFYKGIDITEEEK